MANSELRTRIRPSIDAHGCANTGSAGASEQCSPDDAHNSRQSRDQYRIKTNAAHTEIQRDNRVYRPLILVGCEAESYFENSW